MEKVLVVYASRMGSTAEIAREIADQLIRRGHVVDVCSSAKAPDAPSYDAVIVGSAVHLNHWDKGALHYLQDQAPDLAERPTWLFQSGPCGPEPEGQHAHAPHRISQLCSEIGAHESKVFGGNLDPAHAVTWLDRRLTAGVNAGDHRNWDDIRAWADSIADELAAARVPVAL
jgi:menaquinone-dependent protoporphyrinogen oxidase